MSDTLTIQPFTRPLCAQTVTPPGSKSITNRALLLAALNDGTLTLEGALFSRDTRIMVDCLHKLGFCVEANESAKTIRVEGLGGRIPHAEATLHVGNAGTAARFVTALLALHPKGTYHVDGDTAMRERPMRGLLDALEACGAAEVQYHAQAGYMPFTLKTHGLTGGTVQVDASASSQLLSALLMIAPFGNTDTTVELVGETVSRPFVKMTLQMMRQFGYHEFGPSSAGSTCMKAQESPYAFATNTYRVEPDATAASYFLALPAVTGGSLKVALPSNSLQGDTAFAEVLKANGHPMSTAWNTTLVNHSPRRKLPAIHADFNAISDTFLTLAAIAPLLEGSTMIRGIGHTRHQETDRIAAMATELKKLGQGVEEGPDWLSITPAPLRPCEIDTYDDHRVAMSFGILGCHDLHGDGSPWLTLRDPLCCRKTFPHFFDVLNDLHKHCH